MQWSDFYRHWDSWHQFGSVSPRSHSWKPGLQGQPCTEPRAHTSPWADGCVARTQTCVCTASPTYPGHRVLFGWCGLGYPRKSFPRGHRATACADSSENQLFAAPNTFLHPFVMSSTKLHLNLQLWDTNLALGFSSLSCRPYSSEQSQEHFIPRSRTGRKDTHFVVPGMETFSFQQGSLHKVGFGFVLR